MPNVFEGTPDARQSDDTAHPVSRFRPTYRALTSEEKVLHDDLKTKAAELEMLYAKINVVGFAAGYVSRGLEDLESSVMWAVKGLTS